MKMVVRMREKRRKMKMEKNCGRKGRSLEMREDFAGKQEKEKKMKMDVKMSEKGGK